MLRIVNLDEAVLAHPNRWLEPTIRMYAVRAGSRRMPLQLWVITLDRADAEGRRLLEHFDPANKTAVKLRKTCLPRAQLMRGQGSS